MLAVAVRSGHALLASSVRGTLVGIEGVVGIEGRALAAAERRGGVVGGEALVRATLGVVQRERLVEGKALVRVALRVALHIALSVGLVRIALVRIALRLGVGLGAVGREGAVEERVAAGIVSAVIETVVTKRVAERGVMPRVVGPRVVMIPRAIIPRVMVPRVMSGGAGEASVRRVLGPALSSLEAVVASGVILGVTAGVAGAGGGAVVAEFFGRGDELCGRDLIGGFARRAGC